jgi:hypothetical protein
LYFVQFIAYHRDKKVVSDVCAFSLLLVSLNSATQVNGQLHLGSFAIEHLFH